MLKCSICSKSVPSSTRLVEEIPLYECPRCSLGFVTKNKAISRIKLYNSSNYKKNVPFFRARFDSLISLIQKNKPTGSVLDIGTGYGLFAQMLHEKSFDVEVLEPVSTPLLLDKKIPVHKTSIEKLKIKNKYDIIIMMDVIEHLKNPSMVVEKVKKMLKKKGILVLQTPNYKSIMAQLCTHWSWWMLEEHRYFFTPHSLSKLLKQKKYKQIHLHTYEDFVDFKKNLDGNFTHIKNAYLRRPIKFLFFLFFIPVYFLLRKILWSWGYGGLIFTIHQAK